MLKKYRGVLFLLLFLAAAVGLFAFLNRGSQGFEEKYEGVDLTAEVTGLGRGDTYDGYLLAHEDAGNGDQEIAVDLLSFEGVETNADGLIAEADLLGLFDRSVAALGALEDAYALADAA